MAVPDPDDQSSPNGQRWFDDPSDRGGHGDEGGRPDDVRDWGDGTASGRRGGIAGEISLGQKQSSVSLHRARFERARFAGYITNPTRFISNGDLVISVQIPFEYKHLALPLTDAFGIPLTFDVEVYKPYRDAEGGE